jgi:hypothetical protein
MTSKELEFFKSQQPLLEGRPSDEETYLRDPESNLASHLMFATSRWLNLKINDINWDDFKTYMTGVLLRSFVERGDVQSWLDGVKPHPHTRNQQRWQVVFSIAEGLDYEVDV